MGGDVRVEHGNFIGRDQIIVTPDLAHDVEGLESPYIGLRAFEYNDRGSFAGRDGAVAEAVALLTAPGSERPVLFVVGASGSGKSSLAQAGVLPGLERHYIERNWTPAHPIAFRPLKRPVAMLADGLVRLGLPHSVLSDPIAMVGSASAFSSFVANETPDRQVNLIVIDQFEELFTQSQTDEREALIDILSHLQEFWGLRTHFVITLRSDYLGDLYQYRELYHVAKQGLDLREMDSRDLRAGIERPLQAKSHTDARYAGKAWDADLLDELVSQAAPSAVYLPLLQITLQELWRNRYLTLGAYRRIGGTLASAIQNRASAVLDYTDYNRSQPSTHRSQSDRQLMVRLVLDMVAVSLEAHQRSDVRRSRTRAELLGTGVEAATRTRLLDDLIAARLVSTEQKGGVDHVDIIHESVIANWSQLKQEIAEQRLRLELRARFEQAVNNWVRNGQQSRYLLSGILLSEARLLTKQRDVALRDPLAHKFFRKSVARVNRGRLVSGILIGCGTLVALLIALVIAIFAWIGGNTAGLLFP